MGFALRNEAVLRTLPGLGAYTAGLLGKHGWHEPLSGLVVAGLVAGAVGMVCSLVVARLQSIALLMVTLGIGVMMHEGANQAAAFTGGTGFAARVREVALEASDKYEGSVTGAITSHTTTITRLNASIADWDDRLELRRKTLERQYTALETALSQLNSQSSWLTSQLDSLSASTQ